MTIMTGIKEKAQRFVEWQKLFSIPTRISWALAFLIALSVMLSIAITVSTGNQNNVVADAFEHIAAYAIFALPVAVVVSLINIILKAATKRKRAAKAAEESLAKVDSKITGTDAKI